LAGKYCGTNSPGTVTASRSSGALTFQFHSDYNVTEPGWLAVINCESGGTSPSADFTANATTIAAGEQVQFTDISTNDPNAWIWTFEGGTPASSIDQDPVIEYLSAGVYDVKLVVSNQYGADSVLAEGYITVNEIIDIEELEKNKIRIFPNPADDRINITSNSEIRSISILSNRGEVLLTEINPGNSYNIQTGDLKPGFYLIKITLRGTVLYRKISINH